MFPYTLLYALSSWPSYTYELLDNGWTVRVDWSGIRRYKISAIKDI